MNTKAVLASAFLMASVQMSADTSLAKSKVADKDPVGKCYGVVGAGEGECGGKNPETGDSWSCHGKNPTADLGWKEMKKSECDATPKHKDAKNKKFVANK